MSSAVKDISPEQNGGILKTIIKEGEGHETPTFGSEVEVLIRNVSISPPDEDGEVTKFKLGKGKVVRACEIGISTMRKGERALLTCTSEHANIYPSSNRTTNLEFQVELINWEYEDISPKMDGGIRRILIRAGEGSETPNNGAEVEIHVIGKYKERIFDERRNVCFNREQCVDHDIIQGIDLALGKFKKGETSRLILKPHYAFGENGSEKFRIPSNATIEYEVTLERFIRTKDLWLMDDDEKVLEAKILKEKGNAYLQDGKLQAAIILYNRVIKMLKLFEDGRHIKEGDVECESIFFGTHMNLCLCYLKTENYSEAKHSVNIALRLRPNDEKAHFRAGKVFSALGDYHSAIDAFQQCLRINPSNKAAMAEIKLSSNALQDHVKQERKIYGQMFDRFAEVDTQREKIELNKMLNVMSSVGEWGAEDREREPSEFEKENPDIILLNKTGEFKDM